MRIVRTVVLEEDDPCARVRALLREVGFRERRSAGLGELSFVRGTRLSRYLSIEPRRRPVRLRVWLRPARPRGSAVRLCAEVQIAGLFKMLDEEAFWRAELDRIVAHLGQPPQSTALTRAEPQALQRAYQQVRTAHANAAFSALFFASLAGIASTAVPALESFPLVCGLVGLLFGRWVAYLWSAHPWRPRMQMLGIED